MKQTFVAILMGSDSDLPVMKTPLGAGPVASVAIGKAG